MEEDNLSRTQAFDCGPGCAQKEERKIREKGQFWGDIWPIVKYRDYPACSRYSQPFSSGGSSDAAFCCH